VLFYCSALSLSGAAACCVFVPQVFIMSKIMLCYCSAGLEQQYGPLLFRRSLSEAAVFCSIVPRELYHEQ
jgi:hypothetical protein